MPIAGAGVLTDQTKDNGNGKETADLSELRVRRDSPAPGARDAFLDLKDSICRQLRARGELATAAGQRATIRPYVHDRLDMLLEERGIVLNRGEKRQLLEAIVAELTGSLS